MPKPILLLVGPGKRFGKEIAFRFAQEGFYIALVSKTGISAQSIAEEVRTYGEEAIAEICDVTNAKQCNEVINRLVSTSEGKIESVIFNIKESPKGNGTSLAPDTLTQVLAANVGGALAILQAAMPHMYPNASFIITGGGYKDIPDPEKCALAVSKGALHTLALALVAPCGERNIRVKTVVIDGVVRQEGEITPDRVAQTYWEAHNSKNFETTIKA